MTTLKIRITIFLNKGIFNWTWHTAAQDAVALDCLIPKIKLKYSGPQLPLPNDVLPLSYVNIVFSVSC